MAEAKARNNIEIKNEKVNVWVKLLAVVFIIIALIAIIYRLYTIPNPCYPYYTIPYIGLSAAVQKNNTYYIEITRMEPPQGIDIDDYTKICYYFIDIHSYNKGKRVTLFYTPLTKIKDNYSAIVTFVDENNDNCLSIGEYFMINKSYVDSLPYSRICVGLRFKYEDINCTVGGESIYK